jgi:hypothetical protein
MKAIGIAALICAMSIFVSCKKKTSGSGGESGKPDLKTAAAEATKLVPKELAGKLAFTVGKCRKERCVAVVPKGWDDSFMKGHFNPPKSANLGFHTRFAVGTNCDGDCVSKDWPKTADKVEFKAIKDPTHKVIKDEKKPKGRLAVAEWRGKLYIISVKYKKGGSRYFYCRATLDKEIKAAAAAFEKACLAMAPVEWD